MTKPTKAAQRHPQPNHTCYMPAWLMQEPFEIKHVPTAGPEYRFCVTLGDLTESMFDAYGPTIAAAAKAADRKRKDK